MGGQGMGGGAVVLDGVVGYKVDFAENMRML